MSPAEPRRGEAWWVGVDPSPGGEIEKSRPVVVVSNDAANAALDRVQVVPLTSSVQRLYPGEAYVLLAGERRKAMADQITTAAKQRLRGRLGRLEPADMEAVARAIRVQLAL
jgi:mRNA interferase MazF